MGLQQEIAERVHDVLSTTWELSEPRDVPRTEEVVLGTGAEVMELAVLYCDVAGSSALVSKFPLAVAARIVKLFLRVSTHVISHYGGSITSFDGDRVMAVFSGEGKECRAVRSALALGALVPQVVQPRLTEFLKEREKPQGVPPFVWPAEPFQLRHGSGIDTGRVLIVRAGQRIDNDLIWVGRAANLAARLSEIRPSLLFGVYRHVHISPEVLVKLDAATRGPSGLFQSERWTRVSPVSFAGGEVAPYGTEQGIVLP